MTDMDGEPRQQGRAIRIAATLLNLAALAERAALRSLPIRFLVLAILWYAEAIARNFVASEMEFDRRALESIGQDGDCIEPDGQHLDDFADAGPAPRWPSLDELLPPTGSTLDAELLAMRLRMLAAILLALADAGRIHGDGSAGFFSDNFGWTSRVLRDETTTPAPPLFLIIIYPVARYGIIRPPDTS